MMRAGKLDRRITIERYSTIRNSNNEPEEVWATVGERWASKNDISDSEKVRAAEVGATVTTRFQVRWDSLTLTLTASDRIVCEGKTYDIVGTKEIGRREGIEISASRPNDMLVPAP